MPNPLFDFGSLGLLFLRVTDGLMMLMGHGLGKLLSFTEKYSTFPDPLGVGHQLSMMLAVFAEALCALSIVVGFKTRFAAIPLVITMAVAAGIIHADDPWSKKEFALLYLVPFATLIFTGGGKYTVERFFQKLR